MVAPVVWCLSLALLCPGLGWVECSNSCVGLAQWELMAGGMGCVGVMLPRGFGESWYPGYTSMQPGPAAYSEAEVALKVA